eukprot:TRINITY_DN20223_c0_g1_i1.p1 TRINITY_DN20223_c0_g1~~TRINITY_DN20223_c0_g1_i1.p1  ORF type:complete len:382 (+),score=46.41 TRINITY_DN20223_c0_g1_i1:301-1446(+)
MMSTATPPSIATPSNSQESSPSPDTYGSLEALNEAFPPFVRTDTYGTLGKGPLSLASQVYLLVATVTIFPIRLFFLIIFMVWFTGICWLNTFDQTLTEVDGQPATYVNLRGRRRASITACGRIASRMVLFVMGFYWIKRRTCSSPSAFKSKAKAAAGSQAPVASAVVSNHVSWVDILYHSSRYPSGMPAFVSKKSILDTALVGFLSKCLGCIYVEREVKAPGQVGVAEVIVERMKACQLDAAAPLPLLFPEGTTANGRFLLPFKSGAFLAGLPVQPVLLRYGGPFFNPAWDTIAGKRHFYLLLCQPWLTLEVVELPLYVPSEEEKANPKVYAENVRLLLAKEGNLTLSPLGLQDKRVYHKILVERQEGVKQQPPLTRSKVD